MLILADMKTAMAHRPGVGLGEPDGTSLRAEALRLGNLSGFIASLVTLCITIAIPLCVWPGPGHGPGQGQAFRRRSLTRLWASSQILFTTCILSTLFVRNHVSGIMLMSLVGASWAVTIWVPYALIGEDLSIATGTAAVNGHRRPQVGAIMGLHNLAISGPQIVSALISSLLFCVFSALGYDGGIVWVLRAGGLASLAAAFMIVGIPDE